MLKADELKGEARRPAPARGGRDSASLVRTGPRPRVDIKSSSYEGEAPQRARPYQGVTWGQPYTEQGTNPSASHPHCYTLGPITDTRHAAGQSTTAPQTKPQR